MSFYDTDGKTQTGTKSCGSSTVANCAKDGDVDCIATSTFKAADVTTAIAANIKYGVAIAGVTGTLTSSGTACTSNGQQSCVASGSYFAATACAANGSSCYLPAYAASTQPLKAIDYDHVASHASGISTAVSIGGVTGTLNLTNLTAGNIKSGVTIGGQTGNFPSSTYPLSGASVTADLASSTFNSQIASATAFEYWDSAGTRYAGAGDAGLIAANITSGTTIFGVAGSAAAGSFDGQIASLIHRTVGTTQMTLATEKTTSSYAAGYREIPDIFKDDTAFWSAAAGCTGAGGANQTCTTAIWATRPTVTCGTTQTTIAARIAHCATQNSSAATWNGQTNGIAGEGNWKLVTYTGTYEVWRDERTGLVWSDKVPTNDNWCKATGNAQADDPSSYCNNASYQDQTTPYSYCVEDASHQPALAGENWTTGAYHGIKGGMGAVATGTSPAVRWRLPSRADWMQADIDGVRQVLPNINNTFWSATIYDSLRQRANYFIGGSGTIAASSSLGTVNRNAASAIICVGR